ncbi:MAG: GumC family protein, partial [Marinilabilia sp.]
MAYNHRPNTLHNNQRGAAEHAPQFMIDYRKLFFDLLRFWWLFAITIPLAWGAVHIAHRYITPVYSAKMSILMEERGEDNPKEDMMEGFGLTPGQRNLDNQIAVLTSRDILQQTIDQLDFDVSYYAAGRLKDSEVYGNVPFEVKVDSSEAQILNVPLYVSSVDENHFRLKVDAEQPRTIIYENESTSSLSDDVNFEKTYAYGELIETPWLKIKIENKGLNPDQAMDFYFKFNNPEKLVAEFSKSLQAKKKDENSSIVNVTLTGPNHQKNITFLKKLSETFIQANLEKKNQIASNTIEFIEEQLGTISDSLAQKGTQLSSFRTENQIQSISSEAEHLFNQIQEINKRISEKRLTLNYYSYLDDYFSAGNIVHQELAPAAYDIDNPIISEQINTILSLNSERLTLNGQENPYKKELDKQLKVARQTLMEAIQNQKAIINASIDRLNNEKNQITSELYKLPEKERQLLSIERQFDLNSEVYTFLLRRRSEAQIQKASNTSDHSVLEAPRYITQVSPQTSANYQRAIFVGLLLPLIFVVLRQVLNNRITTNDELEKLTSYPVIGHIIHSQKGIANVVMNFPRSVITETFRRVRSRLEYLTSETESPVISVSSSLPGEGKTFCALNLAAIFAYSGKKTALIGFDMRKPELNKILDIEDLEGLSQYYINKVALDDIIHPSGQDNLSVIPSGAVPPNPAELISSSKTDKLFSDLTSRFDIII